MPPVPDSEDELRLLRERVYGHGGTPSAADVARLQELESGAPGASERSSAQRGDAGPPRRETDPFEPTEDGEDAELPSDLDPTDATDDPNPADRGRFSWRAVVSTVVVALAVGGAAFAAGLVAGTTAATPPVPEDFPELLLPQTQEDVVTSDPDDPVAKTVDLSSTRFIARIDGLDVFLARPADAPGVCIFTRITSSAVLSGVGCSEGSPAQRSSLGYGMVGGLQLYVGEPTGPVTGNPIRLSESVTAYVS